MDETPTEEILAEDSTESLLNEYENRRKNRPDDAAAMQTVVCIILAVSLFFANMRFPETVHYLIERAASLSAQETELIPNPIDLLLSLL